MLSRKCLFSGFVKRLIVVFVSISVLFMGVVSAYEGMPEGVIKSVSELDYLPFSIVTEKGEAGGFSVELLRASLNAVDKEVSFYVVSWDEIKTDDEIRELGVVFNQILEDLEKTRRSEGQKIRGLEKFANVAVGRESKMIELKKKFAKNGK